MTSDLLVFGEDWGQHPSSTQHLIKYIAQTRRTLWVNSIGLRRPRLSLKDSQRLWKKGQALLRAKPAPQQQINHYDHCNPLEVIAPRALPWPGNPLATLCNRLVLARQLRHKLQTHHVDKPLVWTSLPTAVDVVDDLDPRAVIYYCGDDFSALDGVDHVPVDACEQRLSERADLIFAASPALAAKFPSHKTVTLPHGVDFDLFSTPAAPDPACQQDRPIVGFYGSIADWVDIPLLAQAARLRPDWDFMFIGPIKTDVTALSALPNVIFIPPQSHDRLPSFVQHWQAAVLPFKNTPQIQACNPLKLREYLASNTPVLTTDFPALAPYKDYVTTIQNGESFASALSSLKPHPLQRRAVEQESWQIRASQVNDLLMMLDGPA